MPTDTLPAASYPQDAPAVTARPRRAGPAMPPGIGSSHRRGSAPPAYWLKQREGSFWDRGRVFEIPETLNEGTLGRSLSCHWRLNDPAVSRIHAALVRKPRRGVYLIDLASREGTFVNGERINEETLLMAGDRIRLGRSVELEFLEGDRPDQAPRQRWLRRGWWMASGLAVLVAVGYFVF
jgi:hypothetical protein